MIPTPQKASWIAVDWGTSHLRAWSMGNDGKVLDHGESQDGMGKLAPDQFEPTLLKLADIWLGESTTTVIACGMVGSRQGWAEAPYRAVPCAVQNTDLARAPAQDKRLNVRLIPGVKQDSPADVMRGEETQIAGYIARNPDFDGVLCLPGTHCKWVHISAGEIVSFRTFMTGEMFALLSTSSVLRHSIPDSGWDADAFAQAVDEAIARPEAMAARLFSLRAESLLHDLPPAKARARLSGLLIGAELAAAKPYWLGQQVTCIGASPLTQSYASALTAQGAAPTIADGSAMTLAGLTAAYQSLKDQP